MSRAFVLRVGHRPERDQRVTTHVGLAARALGAGGMYLAASDAGVVGSINSVTARWGGDFIAKDGVSWRRCIEEWKRKGGTVVHLTMYGQQMTDVIDEIREKEQVLVVVGAEKVPGDIYGMADYNVSVTTQPHSEISSLALFLDRLYMGEELNREYPDAKIRILPNKAGKKTVEE